jgi:hypothetical protein
MQLWIGDTMTEFENSATGLEMLLEAVKKAADSSGLLLSHLLVDEVAVYNEPWEYLETNLENIQKVQVEFQSIRELMQDILASTTAYLERSIPALENLAESFYTDVNADTWQGLSDFLEGLQWLSRSTEAMDDLPGLADIIEDYEKWNIYCQKVRELQAIAAELDEPLQYTDYVSIGDLLLYEVLPQMRELLMAVASIR